MVHKFKKKELVNKEITLVINIPKNIDTFSKLSDFLMDKYHIDIDVAGDYQGSLFWNPDLRSHMGFVEDFGGGSATLVIRPKFYARAFKKKYNKLLKDGKIIQVD